MAGKRDSIQKVVGSISLITFQKQLHGMLPNRLTLLGLIDDNWKYKEFSDRDSDNLKNGLFVALKKLNYSSKINDQFLNEKIEIRYGLCE
ncbi:19068_t:CDS:2 [Dentiscutata erythropus]|uniref:19068_t:CDS:1 n=1 Tax=Dentiscutata erythropus TaxID=1348616 RepID=A0A9N9D8V7_9GLOM|nr:19068_t:CDS:2 [Dentiscutata erythropus]